MKSNKLEKFTLHVGLDDKDTKSQLIDTLEAYKIIQNLAKKYFDGISIFSGSGFYKYEDGSYSIENTLKIEVLFTNESDVEKFADEIKRILNQEKIAIQKEYITSRLY